MLTNIKKLITQELSFFVTSPAVLWPLVVLILPLFSLIYTSFLSEDGLVFTLANYQEAISFLSMHIIFRSCVYAVLTTLITLCIGYPIAYYVVFYVSKKQYVLFFLTLPFWTNLIVLVYSWFFLLEKGGIINSLLLQLRCIKEPLQLAYTPGAVILVMVYCYLPFMIMPLYTALQKINVKLLEASCDLGAAYVQTLWNVIIPLSLSGIKTGIILVFVPSFGEFIIPALMGGGKELTVGSMVSYYFIVSQNYTIGSAFTICAGIVLLGSVAALCALIEFLIVRRVR